MSDENPHEVSNQELFEAHIERFLGPIESVVHELVHDIVHVDLYSFAPTGEYPFRTIISHGMSELPMTTPSGAEALQYAEVMICLPESWPVEQSDWEDENHYWPLRLLKVIARLPHESGSWMWGGHTIALEAPPKPLAPNTGLAGAILASPTLFPGGFDQVQRSDGGFTRILSVIPLFPEELEQKLKIGASSLLEKLGNHGVNEVLNPGRKNLFKRRFLGLF